MLIISIYMDVHKAGSLFFTFSANRCKSTDKKSTVPCNSTGTEVVVGLYLLVDTDSLFQWWDKLFPCFHFSWSASLETLRYCLTVPDSATEQRHQEAIYSLIMENLVASESSYFCAAESLPTSASMWAYMILYGWNGNKIYWEFPSVLEYSYNSVLCQCKDQQKKRKKSK